MKLTENQLADLFQHSRKDSPDLDAGYLYDSAEASEQRLKSVEKIADSSQLSAAYQVINKLDHWSDALGQSVKLSLKPKFIHSFYAWFKPALATAAVVTAVYFITPELANKNHQTQPDRIMFSASFDGNNDVIKGASFEKSLKHKQNDEISSRSFG